MCGRGWREAERKQGDEQRALVGEGVQNTSLGHENCIELKASENRLFLELPYMPESKASQNNSVVLNPLQSGCYNVISPLL